MCLAVPGKIVAIEEGSIPRTGTVSFGGIRKQVCLDWVPDACIGTYVIVHVGFGIAVLDEADALASLRLISEMTEMAAREPSPPFSQRPG